MENDKQALINFT